MSLFEGASELVIHGGQFGHVTYQLGPHDDSSQIVRRLVEKDSSLNKYSVENGTVTIPRFSKSLLLQDLQVDPDVGRMNAGSCSFDLMVRLGLFPGQPNEALAEYDTMVPLNAVVSRGNCYCGRISRHGFVFLVSKYFQHVTVTETTTGGTCFILSTTIGRFKCYEIDDRTFIHFDSGTRSSYVNLVKDQNLDDILRTARGEYLMSPSGVSSHDVFEWNRSIGESLESIVAGEFYGVPNAVIYMTKLTLQRWKRLYEFADAMLHTVLSVLDGLEEPAEFVSALRSLPSTDDFIRQPSGLVRGTPVENLALSIFFYRILSRKLISEMSLKDFHNLSTTAMPDMFDAHKYFRSPKVDFAKLIKTSHKRFLKIFDGFPTLDGLNSDGKLNKDAYIQKELFSFLHTNKNNIVLVAFQGYFAVVAKWNTSRTLLRAREAPEEWIHFVGAEDDELFMG